MLVEYHVLQGEHQRAYEFVQRMKAARIPLRMYLDAELQEAICDALNLTQLEGLGDDEDASDDSVEMDEEIDEEIDEF